MACSQTRVFPNSRRQQLPEVARGKVRSSEVLSRSRAVGEGGRVMVARILWVGGGWECFFCFSSKNGGGWSRKWWKCFFRRCPGSPYQQSQQVRITLALFSKSSRWNVIRILWHARFWTRKSLLIKICNEKKLKKKWLQATNSVVSWYFVQNATIIKSY